VIKSPAHFHRLDRAGRFEGNALAAKELLLVLPHPHQVGIEDDVRVEDLTGQRIGP
jgi:hypothetical protein